jgi:ABC-2 type transport system permease protein
MNIYFQELKFYRRVTLIWMAAFAIGIFSYMSLFTAFSHDVSESMKLLEGFPPAVRALLGIRIESFFTILGFFGYMLTYLWLIGGIQAMNLGTGIISKEISGKTADFLLSKPVTRVKVLTSKLFAALTIIIATNIVFVLASYFSAQFFTTKSFNTNVFLLTCLTMLFVQLFFLAIGLLVSVLVPKIKSVLSFSLPIVFGFFIIGMLDSVIGIENARYLTPFKYFDVGYIATRTSYEWKYLLTEAAVVTVCIAVAYIVYIRKDIQAPA